MDLNAAFFGSSDQELTVRGKGNRRVEIPALQMEFADQVDQEAVVDLHHEVLKETGNFVLFKANLADGD